MSKPALGEQQARRAKRVFINCPFDEAFKPLFDAALFTVNDLGFEGRHALIDDSSALRLVRIIDELTASQYSIHDISRVELSGPLMLPRFNMPFEAGIAYALHARPRPGQVHHLMIMDAKPHQHSASLSDIAGLDPQIHGDRPETVIAVVRGFLASKSAQHSLPGEDHLFRRYVLFRELLETSVEGTGITSEEITSWRYVNALQEVMREWRQDNPP